MKEVYRYANAYIKECDWKDLSMLKFCLIAMGLLLGLYIPKEKRRPFLVLAGIVFVITYLPLMSKFFDVIKRELD